MNPQALIDWSPVLELALLTLVTVALPLGWVSLRWRAAPVAQRLAAVNALALFLTLDLIAFGAYTRLSDSGLGCPDWPGCYAQSSPWAAREPVLLAQAEQPTGPVTWAKAWIEMIHRYLAMLVGALILVLALLTFWCRTAVPLDWRWPVATLFWVLVQGAFGAYTVTLKLYPLVVSLHLLGALVLFGLLVCQYEFHLRRPLQLSPGLRAAAMGVLLLWSLQAALGAWVSTNYAVLACQGFPQCNGRWWPDADFSQGFTLRHALGQRADGGYLGFDALVAIHWAHRLGAACVLLGGLALVWHLRRQQVGVRRYAAALGLMLLLQVGTGISNVIFDWPLPVALLHSAGAAACVGLLVSLVCRTSTTVRSAASWSPLRGNPMQVRA